MNLAELLTIQADSTPARLALIEADRRRQRTITFAELDSAVARAAGRLREAGLRPGEAVVVFQPISIELYIALAAVLRAGLVATFLDPQVGWEHIEQCCEVWPPAGLIGCPKAHLLRLVSPALRRIPVQFSIGFGPPWTRRFLDKGTPPSPMTPHPAEPDHPALVTFTSGSTGSPKAALRTHGFLFNQQRVLEKALRLVPGEVELTTLPTFVLANLAAGLTTVIPRSDLRSPTAAGLGAAVAQMRNSGVNRVSGAPAFLEGLADYCLSRSETLPRLEKIYTGGGPVFPGLFDKLHGVAPQASITAVYGCTEAEPIALLERRDVSAEDQAAMAKGEGLLAGHTDQEILLRILDGTSSQPLASLSPGEFERRCLPPQQAGEIVVSGRHVLRGYLKAEEAKIRVGQSVWHRTGDAGYRDPQARLWLLGRSAARIQDDHGTVYPLQLETAFRSASRATLVTQGGKRVLVVERQAAKEITAWGELLERWHIDRVELVKSIPLDKRHRSKIDYAALHALLPKVPSLPTPRRRDEARLDGAARS